MIGPFLAERSLFLVGGCGGLAPEGMSDGRHVAWIGIGVSKMGLEWRGAGVGAGVDVGGDDVGPGVGPRGTS